MLTFILNIIGVVLFGIGGFYLGYSFDYVKAGIFFGIGLVVLLVGWLINSIPRKNVKKNRTPYTAEYKCNPERVQYAIDLFMKEKGYALLKYNDEEVYKKGNGWVTPRKFIKCTINEDNTVLIEGWISNGVGNAASTEMSLTAFYAPRQKQHIIQEITELKFRIGALTE